VYLILVAQYLFVDNGGHSFWVFTRYKRQTTKHFDVNQQAKTTAPTYAFNWAKVNQNIAD
jgi:hypothetical protein